MLRIQLDIVIYFISFCFKCKISEITLANFAVLVRFFFFINNWQTQEAPQDFPCSATSGYSNWLMNSQKQIIMEQIFIKPFLIKYFLCKSIFTIDNKAPIIRSLTKLLETKGLY